MATFCNIIHINVNIMKIIHSLYDKNLELSLEIRKINWTKPYMVRKYMFKTLNPS